MTNDERLAGARGGAARLGRDAEVALLAIQGERVGHASKGSIARPPPPLARDGARLRAGLVFAALRVEHARDGAVDGARGLVPGVARDARGHLRFARLPLGRRLVERVAARAR